MRRAEDMSLSDRERAGAFEDNTTPILLVTLTVTSKRSERAGAL